MKTETFLKHIATLDKGSKYYESVSCYGDANEYCFSFGLSKEAMGKLVPSMCLVGTEIVRRDVNIPDRSYIVGFNKIISDAIKVCNVKASCGLYAVNAVLINYKVFKLEGSDKYVLTDLTVSFEYGF